MKNRVKIGRILSVKLLRTTQIITKKTHSIERRNPAIVIVVTNTKAANTIGIYPLTW